MHLEKYGRLLKAARVWINFKTNQRDCTWCANALMALLFPFSNHSVCSLESDIIPHLVHTIKSVLILEVYGFWTCTSSWILWCFTYPWKKFMSNAIGGDVPMRIVFVTYSTGFDCGKLIDIFLEIVTDFIFLVLCVVIERWKYNKILDGLM